MSCRMMGGGPVGGLIVGGIFVGAVITSPIWVPIWGVNKVYKYIQRARPKYDKHPWYRNDAKATIDETRTVQKALGGDDNPHVNIPTQDAKIISKIQAKGCSVKGSTDGFTTIRLPRTWYIVFPDETDCRTCNVCDKNGTVQIRVRFCVDQCVEVVE